MVINKVIKKIRSSYDEFKKNYDKTSEEVLFTKSYSICTYCLIFLLFVCEIIYLIERDEFEDEFGDEFGDDFEDEF